jgi:acetyltransferase-like isoleucine patch superfamily enzyme
MISEMTENILTLMFEYGGLSARRYAKLLEGMQPKIIRWMAIHHPDNKMRRRLLSSTFVSIGEGAVINPGIMISDNYKRLVKIGKRAAISPNVTIIAASAPNNSKLKDDKYVKSRLIKEIRVTIGDDAWIGSNVVILPGVTIGAGAIIGAGSVVTKDIPPRCIAYGVPCRVTRKL